MVETWTALAILGALALGAPALLAMQSARFDSVNQRFDDVNQRFDSVNQRIDEAVRELRSEIRALGERLERSIS